MAELSLEALKNLKTAPAKSAPDVSFRKSNGSTDIKNYKKTVETLEKAGRAVNQGSDEGVSGDLKEIASDSIERGKVGLVAGVKIAAGDIAGGIKDIAKDFILNFRKRTRAGLKRILYGMLILLIAVALMNTIINAPVSMFKAGIEKLTETVEDLKTRFLDSLEMLISTDAQKEKKRVSKNLLSEIEAVKAMEDEQFLDMAFSKDATVCMMEETLSSLEITAKKIDILSYGKKADTSEEYSFEETILYSAADSEIEYLVPWEVIYSVCAAHLLRNSDIDFSDTADALSIAGENLNITKKFIRTVSNALAPDFDFVYDYVKDPDNLYYHDGLFSTKLFAKKYFDTRFLYTMDYPVIEKSGNAPDGNTYYYSFVPVPAFSSVKTFMYDYSYKYFRSKAGTDYMNPAVTKTLNTESLTERLHSAGINVDRDFIYILSEFLSAFGYKEEAEDLRTEYNITLEAL